MRSNPSTRQHGLAMSKIFVFSARRARCAMSSSERDGDLRLLHRELVVVGCQTLFAPLVETGLLQLGRSDQQLRAEPVTVGKFGCVAGRALPASCVQRGALAATRSRGLRHEHDGCHMLKPLVMAIRLPNGRPAARQRSRRSCDAVSAGTGETPGRSPARGHTAPAGRPRGGSAGTVSRRTRWPP